MHPAPARQDRRRRRRGCRPGSAVRHRTGATEERRRASGSAADAPVGEEASLAALCGVSPVEKSSGKSRRRRLNRGGDR
ncbi:transposase [Streptomyces europaeiscabiei]|uniref:transposase n=1 Tax=Streptomyces europaeiscabiei TaxID=146819 RepID=UPI0038D38525